ncbi:hypothetical protein V2J09_007257 [Rumex salicifolius]
MGSHIQNQETETHLHSWGRGSNRIAAASSMEVDNNNNLTISNKKFIQDEDQEPGWKKFLSFVGPGFLVSLAYLDPGNLETDLQAGANHKYELLWVILIGLIFALVIQSLAANLGVSTGKHLSEICKEEYPLVVKYCLWMLAEISVIAADIPEGMQTLIIGTAFALNILFHIPVWVGVILTGFSTILLLGLQRYGVRKLELLIAILVFVMAGCFFGEMSYAKPPANEVLKGMFIPKLNGDGATGDAIALLGALVMPHNLFLHSALVLSRKIPKSVRGINFFLIESGIALFVAFLINVAVISVSGSNVLGKETGSILYAVALLASGQSSTITGTYAGQYIMQGFLDLKMKTWLRNLITRLVAITPSLVVSIIFGASGAGQLIIIASMILSFELPFALIPLLKFSSSACKMGPHKNSKFIIIFSWVLGFGIIGINVYYLSTGFVGWLIHSTLPKVANVFISILVFPLMAVYVLAIIYLTLRKDNVVTFIDPAKSDANVESGRTLKAKERINQAGASSMEVNHNLAISNMNSNKDDKKERGWKKFLSFVGPGFLVSLAYLDPGNLETDLQAGASHKYELLWVVLIGLIFALVIQSLAANLGVSTGKHLAELCKEEYPIFIKYCLWILAEIAVRTLELLIAALVFVMAGCFFAEMSFAKPPANEVLKGMFIPKLNGDGATGDAIALLGALVMPFFLIESGIALFIAFLINVAVISVSGSICASNLSSEDAERCSDLNLNSASFLLKNVLGREISSILYATALLASGQSSTITGTYAGQYVMQMILSFELPFALIPLLKFSSSSCKMGPHRNSIYIIIFSWALGFGLIGINVYYLSTGFVGFLIHSTLPKVANVFLSILVFPLMAVYVLGIIYLTLRKDNVVTFIEPAKSDANVESGRTLSFEHIPHREDLADIPLPE